MRLKAVVALISSWLAVSIPVAAAAEYGNPGYGNPGDRACRPYDSILHAFKPAFVSKACSSLLHSKTITKTVTKTQTIVASTRTNLVAATRTKKITKTNTVVSTNVVTLTNTVDIFHFVNVTETSTYPASVVPRVAEREYKPPEPWKGFGLVEAKASQACSCYLPNPKPKPTTTKTSMVTKTVRKTITATVTKTSGTKSITKTAHATVTSVEYDVAFQTSYTDVTLSITVTVCSGANPSPNFNIRISDTTATRTDSYNSLYAATPTPNPYLSAPFFTLPFVKNEPNVAFLNIDCLGRLYIPGADEETTLYAVVDYFQPGFELVRFASQYDIELRGFLFIYCSIDNQGILNCVSTQQDVPPMTLFQTCPEYDDFFDTPLVIANYQQTDTPECYGLEFQAVH